MTPAPITIYTGVAWIDEEYFDIEANGSALDLSDYDLQMQILDADDSYSILAQPTITKDSATTGRAWPSMTAAQTTACYNKEAVWILLLRPTDQSQEPRLIGTGRADVKVGAAWA